MQNLISRYDILAIKELAKMSGCADGSSPKPFSRPFF